MPSIKHPLLALLFISTPALSATPAATKAETPVAIIDTVAPKDATGDVAKIYNAILAQWHMVPNPIKLYSTNPALMKNKWASYQQMDKHKTVGPKLQTIIRMTVSHQHDCQYCVGMNEALLINAFKMDASKVMAMKQDPSVAPLPANEKALLLFVLKAVDKPKSITKADIKALNNHGWSDPEIFFATNYAAEMVASDILINAFKVEIDY